MRHEPHATAPDPSVEPHGRECTPCIEADNSAFVELVYKEAVPQEVEDLWLNALERVRGLNIFDWLASVEPPTETEAKKEDHGRRKHHSEDAIFSEAAEIQVRLLAGQK